jgi:hypothetical protein
MKVLHIYDKENGATFRSEMVHITYVVLFVLL